MQPALDGLRLDDDEIVVGAVLVIARRDGRGGVRRFSAAVAGEGPGLLARNRLVSVEMMAETRALALEVARRVSIARSVAGECEVTMEAEYLEMVRDSHTLDLERGS